MKFLLSLFFSLMLTLFFSLQIVFSQDSVLDLDSGEQIFSANCVACHAGGNNSVMPEKTLKIDALERYSKNSADAIIIQVTNGNGGMPPFGDKLSDDEIKNVANYVLNQAKTSNW
uniref:Cytochrome c6 n=1 Tax=Laurencieae sp. TaxID=2007162 RepID=A0A1Z1M2S1_9FLOR|nr:cytochrome c553 [Laurencieae sp.]